MAIRSAPTPLADRYVLDLLSLVEEYRAATAMPYSTIGREAFGDGMFLTRIRKGQNITLDKAKRLESWLRQNMPRPEKAAA